MREFRARFLWSFLVSVISWFVSRLYGCKADRGGNEYHPNERARWIDQSMTLCDQFLRLQTRPVRLHHRAQQHIRAILNILRPREFFRRMADTADAGNEDHADWTDACHVLCVMAGAAGH